MPEAKKGGKKADEHKLTKKLKVGLSEEGLMPPRSSSSGKQRVGRRVWRPASPHAGARRARMR